MDLIQQLQTPDFVTGFAESRIGGRTENQDSYGSSDTPYGFVVTVCDGMGGGPGGKTASTIAVNEIINGIKEGNPDDTASNIIMKAVRRANLAIIEKGHEIPSLKGMGSTCTVLLITEESAIVAHVGDSRIYQLRGKTKVFRTFDHSMVFDLVRQKVITEEQARLSAQSNVITRALGITPDVKIDIVELPYMAGDRFLLSTDGIHGSLEETTLIEMAADKKHALGTVTDEIVTTIDGNGRKEGGGHDNLTVAIIETKINSKLRPKMSAKTKSLFAAVTLICLLSLIFNVILLTRNKSSVTKDAPAAQIQIDSLKNLISDKDEIITQQQSEIKQIQSTAASSDDSLKSVITGLSNQLSALNSKIKEKAQDDDKPKAEIGQSKGNKSSGKTKTN